MDLPEGWQNSSPRLLPSFFSLSHFLPPLSLSLPYFPPITPPLSSSILHFLLFPNHINYILFFPPLFWCSIFLQFPWFSIQLPLPRFPPPISSPDFLPRLPPSPNHQSTYLSCLRNSQDYSPRRFAVTSRRSYLFFALPCTSTSDCCAIPVIGHYQPLPRRISPRSLPRFILSIPRCVSWFLTISPQSRVITRGARSTCGRVQSQVLSRKGVGLGTTTHRENHPRTRAGHLQKQTHC